MNSLDTRQTSITHCDPAAFEAMVAFIAGLNGHGEDHIGYFDTSLEEIARSLRSLSLPVDEGFRLAIQDGQIVGVLGIEADPEIERAWIYGPLVRHPHWMAVADELFAAAVPAIPLGIHQQQMFCDGRNRNCQAARHRYPTRRSSGSQRVQLA